MKKKRCILVVEKREELYRRISFALRGAGFVVRRLEKGDGAVEAVEESGAILAVIGTAATRTPLPQLIRRLRESGFTHAKLSLMIIGERFGTEAVAEVLDAGADDFLSVPFETAVLVARVRALLRCGRGAPATETKVLQWAGVELDPSRDAISYGNRKILLTRSQFKLVHGLVRGKGRVISREELIEIIQGEGITVTPRTVDLHVLKIRRKLGKFADLIETVRGFGYRVRKSMGGPSSE